MASKLQSWSSLSGLPTLKSTIPYTLEILKYHKQNLFFFFPQKKISPERRRERGREAELTSGPEAAEPALGIPASLGTVHLFFRYHYVHLSNTGLHFYLLACPGASRKAGIKLFLFFPSPGGKKQTNIYFSVLA